MQAVQPSVTKISTINHRRRTNNHNNHTNNTHSTHNNNNSHTTPSVVHTKHHLYSRLQALAIIRDTAAGKPNRDMDRATHKYKQKKMC